MSFWFNLFQNRYFTSKTRSLKPLIMIPFFMILLTILVVAGGCGSDGSGAVPELNGKSFSEVFTPEYAQHFQIYEYDDGFMVVEIENRQYIVIPEGRSVPDGLPPDRIVLRKPFQHIYMAASAVMSLMDELGCIDRVDFSAIQESGWYVDSAQEAMRLGELRYAGKYSQPDYEMLLEGGCDVALESTMILHSPEIQEKLEELGIPVLIDCSSYEADPLGRLEWIRLYGRLLDCEAQADAFFQEQVRKVKALDHSESERKEVAFFFVDTSGQVVVRKTRDYIPNMIQMAGGSYVFPNLEQKSPENHSGSVKLSMEAFYEAARDADYLIYNATIDRPLTSVDDLLAKDPLFADFQAVKEGNVWTTDKYFYQATNLTADFVVDVNGMLHGEDDAAMTFLRRVSGKEDS